MSQSEKRFWWWALLVSTVAWLLFGRGAGAASSSRAGGDFLLSQKQRDLIAASTSAEYKALVKAGAPMLTDGSVKVPDDSPGDMSLKVTYMKPDGSISVVW